MAYLDQRAGTHRRVVVVIAVALLEGAAIVALVNGLAVKFIPREPETRTAGEMISMPVPQPSEAPKPKDVAKRPDQARLPPLNSPVDLSDVKFDPPLATPDLPGLPDDSVVIEIPRTPPTTPPALPRAASPIGRPGEWVTANDYPPRDLREGNQGTTGFRLTIDARGRVRSCAVTQPSGFAGLDEATCRHLLRRAKFRPATDGSGGAVASEYANRIRWEIPA